MATKDTTTLGTKKYYRVVYRQRFKDPSIINFDEPNALQRANAICISCMPDGPKIFLITETAEEIPIVRKPVEKWVNPEH